MAIRSNLVAAATFIALLTLSGCSAGADEAVETPSSSDDVVESPSARMPVFEAVCTDEVGDASGDATGDLKSVSLTSDGTLLYVDFELASPLGESDLPTSTFQVFSYGLDGNGGYILGAKFMSGTSAIYAFDNESASQQNYDNGYVFDDGVVSVRFPVPDLSNYADGISWYGTLSVNGTDTDMCGDPMGDSLDVVF